MFARLSLAAAFAIVLSLAANAHAEAIPVFAHRYGLTCQACHTEVPHLTAFGEAFMANGYRLRGMQAKPAFPAAVRVQLAYANGDSAQKQGGLPKAVVDEVELLLGGPVGQRGTFWTEAYVIDGGQPGRPRDVWYADRLTPDGARTPVAVRAGQFTLPLPLDPETFRETTDHYAIWDQTVGANPFAFFTPKIGLQFEAGNPARALGASISVLQGHDVASGLPSHGADTMLALARELGPFRLNAYRYDGTRIFGDVNDRFWRQGYGVGWTFRGTELDAVYQHGYDAAGDSAIGGVRSSGGFVQLRQALGTRTFAIARWDATQDTKFGRAVTAGLGYRPTRNTRLGIFQTVRRDEEGRLRHIISSSFLIAW